MGKPALKSKDLSLQLSLILGSNVKVTSPFPKQVVVRSPVALDPQVRANLTDIALATGIQIEVQELVCP